tara:strand:- start:44 stop:325 length:282 start_codon:yes stop_codon:yes gene_type:complete
MIPPMVNIVWLDTNECSLSAWQSKEELLKSEVCTIDSIGFLIENNDNYVIISGDKDNKNEDDIFGRSQIIPKGVVIEIQYLQVRPSDNAEYIQ